MVASISDSDRAQGPTQRWLTVLYDGDCGVCSETARALAKLDRRRALRLVPLQSALVAGQPSLDQLLDSLHAVDEAGHWWVGADAMVEIARRIPLLRPITVFARFAPGHWAAEKLYRLIANHRQTISRVLGMNACKRPDHVHGHRESHPRLTGPHP
jgi:predicted DCC family thiol-disulfide oxidoreductase YuxK